MNYVICVSAVADTVQPSAGNTRRLW